MVGFESSGACEEANLILYAKGKTVTFTWLSMNRLDHYTKHIVKLLLVFYLHVIHLNNKCHNRQQRFVRKIFTIGLLIQLWCSVTVFQHVFNAKCIFLIHLRETKHSYLRVKMSGFHSL